MKKKRINLKELQLNLRKPSLSMLPGSRVHKQVKAYRRIKFRLIERDLYS